MAAAAGDRVGSVATLDVVVAKIFALAQELIVAALAVERVAWPSPVSVSAKLEPSRPSMP